MSDYETPHYMESYYQSRIAELESQLKKAKAELARLAVKQDEVSWIDSPDFDPL